jgi:DNA-binding response OmpR family regulator
MSNAGGFAAQLRHELRTPINAILGYSQLLLEEADGSRFGATDCHDLERVAEAGRQLLRIVDDGLRPADVPAHDVRQSLARLRHEMRLPLSAAHGHVATLLERHRDGTSADDLRRIHSAVVCLTELVESVQNGSLDAIGVGAGDPRPGTGVDAGGAADTLEAILDGHATAGTILVIDDVEANRVLLTRRLTRQGHAVLTAETGEAGLAVAAAHPVDVILLDVMMPGISGYDVLARLKQDAQLREIPVLMITAVDGSASVTRCITLGADDYLAKPFDPVVLSARVSACVTKKRARDFELAYLRGVEHITEAAAAVESGRFVPSTLDVIAARPDALGRLARLFQRMAVEVAARERRLEAQLHQLTIAIDEQRKAAQVDEITESDYFRDLKARAQHFSVRRAARKAGDR